jgi:hypothetical protein
MIRKSSCRIQRGLGNSRNSSRRDCELQRNAYAFAKDCACSKAEARPMPLHTSKFLASNPIDKSFHAAGFNDHRGAHQTLDGERADDSSTKFRPINLLIENSYKPRPACIVNLQLIQTFRLKSRVISAHFTHQTPPLSAQHVHRPCRGDRRYAMQTVSPQLTLTTSQSSPISPRMRRPALP